MNDPGDYIKGMAKRTNDVRPMWNDVEEALRKGMRLQLERSKDPAGRSYRPLKDSTLKKPRGSARPYDTTTRTTWDAYASGGRITKSKHNLKIEIATKGAPYAGAKRPVGVSDKTADEIANLVADYIIED